MALLNTAIKPALMIWVRVLDVSSMSLGLVPKSWHYEKPPDTVSEFVQIMIPADYFIDLQEKKRLQDINTQDLPF